MKIKLMEIQKFHRPTGNDEYKKKNSNAGGLAIIQ